MLTTMNFNKPTYLAYVKRRRFIRLGSMSSPETKSLLLSLPDELLLNCIARVSRLYHSSLFLVCKRFRSLIASPELYKVRSVLGLTESCLYVCLKFLSFDSVPVDYYRMYTLCRNPDLLDDGTKKSSGYVLVTVPVPHCTLSESDDLVSVGSDIYKFSKSSNVSILDCGTHTWRGAPSLPVKKKVKTLSASVVARKIYVAEKLVHVFDTKSQIWDPLPIHCSQIKGGGIVGSGCVEGKFHVHNGGEVVAYDSKEGRWDSVVSEMGNLMLLGSFCEIENVLYSAFYGFFKYYDTEEGMWRELKGLVRFPELRLNVRVSLVDYGGKMAVFWTNNSFNSSGFERMLWCGVIALERGSKSGEIWGKVEWVDNVLSMPNPFQFREVVNVLTVTD